MQIGNKYFKFCTSQIFCLVFDVYVVPPQIYNTGGRHQWKVIIYSIVQLFLIPLHDLQDGGRGVIPPSPHGE